MPHYFSLAFLTVGNISPVETIKIAAQYGYKAVGLRMLPAAPTEPAYPLLTDKQLLNDTKQALLDYNMAVGDVEIIRLKDKTNIADFKPFIERAYELGAKNILVAGDDFDVARLSDNFAEFCQLAATANLTADLEFMPWTAVKSLNEARNIVENAGEKNGGVLIDALHFDRSTSSLDDVVALPPAMIHYVQLCDGPVPYGKSDEELIAIARSARLMPGDGGIDLPALMQVVPQNTPISIEVASHEIINAFGVENCARMAIESARKILDLAQPDYV
ncbi:sugar phosphate isomerase/epimerase [Bartonella sp. HY038]|uniref:sugar phosphate isomerase/epimerase family protein n=1 Tax=Bartonella sp. HY038 TaxID=2759660 RepID=UPI0015F9CBC6|nr:sugar phosphate isomerase/epimerase [Bartonella sp. HY038]